MAQRARQRFSILDALVLVGGCALGLTPLKFAVGLDLFNAEGWSGFTFVGRMSLAASVHGTPLLAALTLAVLLLNFRGPHRSLRRLSCKSGFVACLVASLAMNLRVGYFAVQAMAVPGGDPPLLPVYYLNLAAGLPLMAGPMVIAAWLPMVMRRRWWPAPVWIDRAGCVLGVCWVSLFLEAEGYQIVRMLLHR